MPKKSLLAAAALVASTLLTQSAFATLIDVTPSMVPDEEPPRVVNSAPTGYGPDAWQGPATGKSNYHVRYLADGDALSALFPSEAAGLTIADIDSISYRTNRPVGGDSGRDWWVQIYTRDTVEWYKDRYINNYNEHTEEGVWTEYSTDSGMTFRRNGSKVGNPNTALMSFSGLQSLAGTDLIEMISVQTNSGWNGFDGYMDGLEITLNSGAVGQVNFTGEVPEPATTALLGAGLVGLFGVSRRRTRKA